MTCYDSQIIERLTIIQLDSCGAIPDTGTPALKGLEETIQNVTRTRQVDLPADNRTKTVNGGTCVKPRATPIDRGFSYGITTCGANPLLEVITGYKSLDLNGSSEITGWEDIELTGSPKAALEIIFTPSADSCDGGAAPKCIAVLIPMLEQWVRSGDESYDGSNIPDLVMTGQTALSANLFSNYTQGALPAWLDHWDAKFNDIATGRSWAYTALIDCPTASVQDACTLVAI